MACADGKAAESIANDVDIVDAATSSGTDQVVDQQIFDQAAALICDTDRKTLQTAIDAFTAMEGRPPNGEAELVGMFLRGPSESFDVAADGTLIPAAGSTCT